MYPQVSEILSRINAAELIGEHVPLRASGKTLKGLCPFHPEKTPSFHVNRERGLWHCFGCGAGGDVVSFLMKIQNLSFLEVKDFLAKKAGVPLEQPSDRQSQKRKREHDALEHAADFYHQMLSKSAPGEQGLAYLQARGVSPDLIEKFRIGMAPAGSRGLFSHLSSKNYSVEELRSVGLISRSDPPRDYFFKRIIFPIWDTSGRTIGFGGRALGDEQPKYLNSAETPFFKKGENLYAFHLAKTQIAKDGFSILAEGYLDVIILHQFGFSQAVATLGTSLTSNQARLLARFSPKIILGYDGDRAGNLAMRRALAVAQGSQVDLGLIAFPPEDDPDSFLRKYGAEAFRALLSQSASPVEFTLSALKREHNPGSPEGKKKIMEELTPLLAAIVDPVVKDASIRSIAQDLGLSESVVRRLSTARTSVAPSKIEEKPSREQELMTWLLWEPSLGSLVWTSLLPADFDDARCRESAEILYRAWQENKQSLSQIESIPEETLAFLSRLSTRSPVGSIEGVAALVKAQQNQKIRKELAALKQELGSRLKEGKVESTDEAYQKYLTLLRGGKKS